MAATTTINPADFANRQYAAILSKKLHEALKITLVLAEYGMPWDYDTNQGSQTMRWFRPRKANTTSIEEITNGANEMTSPTSRKEVAIGYGEVTLKTYGDTSEISNLTRAIDIFQTLKIHVDTMRDDLALKLDSVIRDAIVAKHQSSAIKDSATGLLDKFNRFCGIDNSTGNTSTRFSAFDTASATPATTKFKRVNVAGAAAFLKSQLVPKKNGKYVCAVPPLLIGDLRNDTTVLGAFTNVDSAKLWRGGLAELDGVVFVEHDNPYRWTTNFDVTSSVAAGDKYGAIMFGADAFVCPKLKSSELNYSDPRTPKITVLGNADKSDPHNLKTIISHKAMYAGASTLTNETTDVPRHALILATSTVTAD